MISKNWIKKNSVMLALLTALMGATVIYSPAAYALTGLSWEAEAGTITSPFAVTTGSPTYVSQTVSTTTPSSGGEATYAFSISTAGDYLVKAVLNTTTYAGDSLFVNMDGEPTSSEIWDVGLTNGYETRTASWRGSGSSAAPQYSPKVFTLAAGSHTLYIRGREPNVKMDKVMIVPVRQWDPIQLQFAASGTPAWDSFPLQVTFTNGSTSITVDGYKDGGETNNVWMVRFTPTLTGAWSWTSSSTDTGMNGKSGSFTAAAPSSSDISGNANYRGHLKISSNGHYYTYADGTPVLLTADTVWNINTTRAGIANGHFMTYLNDRKSKGFNTSMMKWFALDQQNEGGFAFTTNTTNPGNGDFSGLNPAYWQWMDQRIHNLWTNGFIVEGQPDWIGTENMSVANAEHIGRYILARYGAYNMIYSLSGEYYKGISNNNSPWNSLTNWNSYGAYMKTYNDAAFKHPLTVHPGPSQNRMTTTTDFNSQSWLTVNWLQTGQGTSNLYHIPVSVLADYNNSTVRPAYFAEGWYEDASNGTVSDDYHVRYEAWSAVLSGSLTGFTYGATGVYSFYDPADPNGETGTAPWDNHTWSTNLALTGSGHMQYIQTLFNQINWWQLAPHRDYVNVNGSAAPQATSSDFSPPQAAASANSSYVVYIPKGNSSKTLQVTHLGTSLTYTARWFNPRTGAFTNIGTGSITSSSSGTWTLPSLPDTTNDWVLLLNR